MNIGANYKRGNLDLDFGASISSYDGDHFGEIAEQFTSLFQFKRQFSWANLSPE